MCSFWDIPGDVGYADRRSRRRRSPRSAHMASLAASTWICRVFLLGGGCRKKACARGVEERLTAGAPLTGQLGGCNWSVLPWKGGFWRRLSVGAKKHSACCEPTGPGAFSVAEGRETSVVPSSAGLLARRLGRHSYAHIRACIQPRNDATWCAAARAVERHRDG